MELYLLRHGQALSETENPEQPLSKTGVAQIQTTAAAMKQMGMVLDLIVSSPKKRSHQTAALIAEWVNYPYSDIIETATVTPTAAAAEALSFLRRYQQSKAVLIAGHLPSLANIAALLLGCAGPLPMHFENGSLCRIDLWAPATGQGELVWHIPAEQLRMIAGK
jgi:phosphohistidine phosphatase